MTERISSASNRPEAPASRSLVDGYIALTYPRERTGVGPGSFQIATYGDGSTENPHSKHHGTDAIYLVNLPWNRENYRHEIIDTIEQAYYLSRAPKYAWFLSHEVEREPSLLYGENIPFGLSRTARRSEFNFSGSGHRHVARG